MKMLNRGGPRHRAGLIFHFYFYIYSKEVMCIKNVANLTK